MQAMNFDFKGNIFCFFIRVLLVFFPLLIGRVLRSLGDFIICYSLESCHRSVHFALHCFHGQMTNYYHYTDKSGWQAIKSSGFIKESVRLDAGDDAVFGRGR